MVSYFFLKKSFSDSAAFVYVFVLYPCDPNHYELDDLIKKKIF